MTRKNSNQEKQEKLDKIPAEWKEVNAIIVDIGKKLRGEMVSNKAALKQYHEWLRRLTGAYMFFIPLFKKYRSAKTNNEVATYVNLMLNWDTEERGKFVSKAAELESSKFVAHERAVRDWLDSQVLAAEQGIRTIKKQMDIIMEERKIEKKSDG